MPTDAQKQRLVSVWEQDEKKRLLVEEGQRMFPYQDKYGNWTIGCGHNIEADPVMKLHLSVLMKTGITNDQMMALLDQDIITAEKDLFRVYPWAQNIDDVRKEVLVDMTFNMGINKLFQFHNTMLEIKEGMYQEAASRLMQSDWYNEVGDRAVNLCQMLRTGKV